MASSPHSRPVGRTQLRRRASSTPRIAVPTSSRPSASAPGERSSRTPRMPMNAEAQARIVTATAARTRTFLELLTAPTLGARSDTSPAVSGHGRGPGGSAADMGRSRVAAGSAPVALDVPDVDRRAVATTGQRPAVGAERHAGHLLVVATERVAELLAGGDVPQPDDRVD